VPLYAYRCDECGHLFDVRASFAEKQAGLEPACPACQGRRERLCKHLQHGREPAGLIPLSFSPTTGGQEAYVVRLAHNPEVEDVLRRATDLSESTRQGVEPQQMDPLRS
jgi:putative FmdB family regulatory protein